MAQKDVGNKIPIYKLKKTDDTETGYHEFFIKSKYIKSEFLVIDTDDFLNEIRLTLDYPEDLKLAEKVFENQNYRGRTAWI
mgnify:CR=1 FL=1